MLPIQRETATVYSILLVIATASVILRFAARKARGFPLDDDWVILFALISAASSPKPKLPQPVSFSLFSQPSPSCCW